MGQYSGGPSYPVVLPEWPAHGKAEERERGTGEDVQEESRAQKESKRSEREMELL